MSAHQAKAVKIMTGGYWQGQCRCGWAGAEYYAQGARSAARWDAYRHEDEADEADKVALSADSLGKITA